MSLCGTIIAGRYRIEREIGRGGMGVVVQARHLELDEDVALKLVHPDVVGSPNLAERLIREARHSFRISSEHVVRVLDVGRQDNGAPFLVMEYLRGEDLAEVLRRRGPMPVPLAASLLLEACRGVGAAHALGIVHRDLKPANLFLSARPDGTELVKVLDFGISRALSSGDSELTTSRAVIGSPKYMAPEQMIVSGPLDARVDVWALGVTLFQLVTGKVPFSGGSVTEILSTLRLWESGTSSLSEESESFSLGPLLARCLALEPSERFASANELATALAEFASPARESLLGDAGRHYDSEQSATVACGPPPIEEGPTGTTSSVSCLETPHAGVLPATSFWSQSRLAKGAVLLLFAVGASIGLFFGIVGTGTGMGKAATANAARSTKGSNTSGFPVATAPIGLAQGALTAVRPVAPTTAVVPSIATSDLVAAGAASNAASAAASAATTRGRVRPRDNRAPTPTTKTNTSGKDPWGWQRR